jgi:hypothetical protein
LYHPASHIVQLVAPDSSGVFVVHPAAEHAMQLAKPAVLYFPATQLAHATVEAALY